MITITIRTDNAAFEGDDKAGEVARILRTLADKLERDGSGAIPCRLRDINGNLVGMADETTED